MSRKPREHIRVQLLDPYRLVRAEVVRVPRMERDDVRDLLELVLRARGPSAVGLAVPVSSDEGEVVELLAPHRLVADAKYCVFSEGSGEVVRAKLGTKLRTHGF